MNPTLRNILAVVTGLIVGSVVNMGIIMLSGSVIPPPPGVDNTTLEGLKASMHLFEPRHFIFPFVAHALGTLVGAIIAALMAVGSKLKPAMIVAILFMLGGIANVFMLPSPVWFSILDVAGAYIPMALLAVKLVAKKQNVK